MQTMDRSFAPFDRQPIATTGNRSQRELSIHAEAPPVMPAQMLPACVVASSSFNNVLASAAQFSGLDNEVIAEKIHICAGYMSRFMRGVGQQWAKRLVLFMRVTNSLAPLQWIADQVGCDVVLRDSRAAEVAALRSRLQELGERAA